MARGGAGGVLAVVAVGGVAFWLYKKSKAASAPAGTPTTATAQQNSLLQQLQAALKALTSSSSQKPSTSGGGGGAPGGGSQTKASSTGGGLGAPTAFADFADALSRADTLFPPTIFSSPNVPTDSGGVAGSLADTGIPSFGGNAPAVFNPGFGSDPSVVLAPSDSSSSGGGDFAGLDNVSFVADDQSS